MLALASRCWWSATWLIEHRAFTSSCVCALEADGIPVELLHGRFNVRDRLAKEKFVRSVAGSKSQHRRGIVLVATQVVEVSLDIDLDTIYSDPAPLEALVQRFGRINRRRLQTDLRARARLPTT